MDGNTAVLIIGTLIGVGFTAAGYLLPYLTGGTYHEAKWRFMGPLIIIMMIWIALTPNGCSLG